MPPTPSPPPRKTPPKLPPRKTPPKLPPRKPPVVSDPVEQPRTTPTSGVPTGDPFATGTSNAWDSKWSLASKTPGWIPADGPISQYNQWVKQWMSGVGAAAVAKFGSAAQAWAWRARQDNWTPEVTDYEAARLGLLPSAGGGGGGGGGYGGGGGGATKDEQYAQASASIKNQAETMGVHLDDNELLYTAHVVVDQSWSGEMVGDWLVGMAEVRRNAGLLKDGTITADITTIKEMAANQLITISDETARQYSLQINSQEMNIDTLQSVFAQQASARYAWATPVIGQGISMRNYLLPSRDTIANELEVAAGSIDMMDGKWLDMMQTIGKDGATRAATQSELTQRARQDPAFKQTSRARDMAASAGSFLREYMGA